MPTLYVSIKTPDFLECNALTTKNSMTPEPLSEIPKGILKDPSETVRGISFTCHIPRGGPIPTPVRLSMFDEDFIEKTIEIKEGPKGSPVLIMFEAVGKIDVEKKWTELLLKNEGIQAYLKTIQCVDFNQLSSTEVNAAFHEHSKESLLLFECAKSKKKLSGS